MQMGSIGIMSLTEFDLAEYIGSLLADLRKLAESNDRLTVLARLIGVAESEAAAIMNSADSIATNRTNDDRNDG